MCLEFLDAWQFSSVVSVRVASNEWCSLGQNVVRGSIGLGAESFVGIESS
jgi:hypothetical protein